MTETPCQQGDPEDWFIEKDGTQYGEEVSAEEKREALIRRRQAKQSCFSCPARLPCLTAALDLRPRHGTWGGYYSNELTKLYAEIDERQRRRVSVG